MKQNTNHSPKHNRHHLPPEGNLPAPVDKTPATLLSKKKYLKPRMPLQENNATHPDRSSSIKKVQTSNSPKSFIFNTLLTSIDNPLSTSTYIKKNKPKHPAHRLFSTRKPAIQKLVQSLLTYLFLFTGKLYIFVIQ